MNIRGILHLFVVYVVWGSTYLAIRVAVREGSGFPAFLMAGSRVLTGSLILILLAMWKRSSSGFSVSLRELGILAVSGVLLWVGGNGLVSWAEQYLDSGYAALLVGSTPIWVAMIESVLDRNRPSLRLIGALFTGLSGVAVLNGGAIIHGSSAGSLTAGFAILAAAISWGAGSILQRRHPVGVSPEVSSGLQQAAGGLGLILTSLCSGETVPHPVPGAWVAWSYLVVFGSVVAFTSFVKALQLLPTKVVMTYAYVNPVIAVFLGWLLLDESISLWTVSGTLLVILGVVGVFSEKKSEKIVA